MAGIVAAMRTRRIKLPNGGYYHVISRIGGKRFLLDDVEKGRLWSCISRAAAFSGVELLSWAVMSNHFHLLVRVPQPREISDGELERRMRVLYGPAKFAAIADKWEKWAAKDGEPRVEEEKERLKRRMHDLSQFCKTFKEEFSQDYNKRHDNTGTIWEGRFKSVILEGSSGVLSAVSAYIHMNPVRAGIAKTPESAKWTSFGAACAGNASGIEAMRVLAGVVTGAKRLEWSDARAVLLEKLASRQACGTDVSKSTGRGPARDNRQKTTKAESSVSRSGITAGKAASGRIGAIGKERASGNAKNAAAGAFWQSRVAAFSMGGAIGCSSFLSRLEPFLPPHKRETRPRTVDGFGLADIAVPKGVRNVS